MDASQVVLITGASAGIGAAIALELARPEVTLYLVGRNAARLENVAAACRERAAFVRWHLCELSDQEQLGTLAQTVQRDLGRLDVLVHAAGVFAGGPVAGTPVEAMESVFATNFRAPYALTRALLPLLTARRGQVVFINSTAGLRVHAGSVAYGASKHALRALADGLRDEVNGAGVRVLSIYPGRTATAMQAAVHDHEGRDYRPELLMQPADVAGVVAQALAAPRTVELTDIRMRPMQTY